MTATPDSPIPPIDPIDPSEGSDLLRAARASAAGAGHFRPPTPAELAPHFPQLDIQALIGSGGMGAVYRVRQIALGRDAALKILPGELGVQPGFSARFQREAQALARLNHPHLVGVYDHGVTPPWPWLLMELVDGANLREVVRTGRLSPAETLALVPPLCSAVQYAHDQGVVHRDIKPENILIDSQGRVKLTDFGLAKLGAADDDTLTRSGAVLGSLHYMAPEQIEGSRSVDHRADIYSLGVVLYELLTGGLPLGRFQPPSQQVAVDVRIDAVVLRALEKDPERRYQRAGDVEGDVTAAAQPVASKPADAPQDARHDAQRERPAFSLGREGVQVGAMRIDRAGIHRDDEDPDPIAESAPRPEQRFLPATLLVISAILTWTLTDLHVRVQPAKPPQQRTITLTSPSGMTATGTLLEADGAQIEVTSAPLRTDGTSVAAARAITITAIIAVIGGLLGAWSLFTLRCRPLAVAGGIAPLLAVPVVWSQLGWFIGLIQIFAGIWIVDEAQGRRLGRCFDPAAMAEAGLERPSRATVLAATLALLLVAVASLALLA